MNSDLKKSTVKISYDTNVKKAIDYVIDMIENKQIESVKLIGLSQAITKVILIVEVVKARIKNLHQINYIDCLIAKDKYDSSKDKNVPKIEIVLTTKEPLEKGDGYQMPLNENEFKRLCEIKSEGEEKELEDDEEDNIHPYTYL